MHPNRAVQWWGGENLVPMPKEKYATYPDLWATFLRALCMPRQESWICHLEFCHQSWIHKCQQWKLDWKTHWYSGSSESKSTLSTPTRSRVSSTIEARSWSVASSIPRKSEGAVLGKVGIGERVWMWSGKSALWPQRKDWILDFSGLLCCRLT